MIHLDSLVLREFQPVKLRRKAENAVYNVVKFEIRTQLLLIETIKLVLQLVGIIAIIPSVDCYGFPLKF